MPEGSLQLGQCFFEDQLLHPENKNAEIFCSKAISIWDFRKISHLQISRLWCYTASIPPPFQSHYLRSKILKHVFLTRAPFSPCIPGKPSIPGEPGGPVGPCK